MNVYHPLFWTVGKTPISSCSVSCSGVQRLQFSSHKCWPCHWFSRRWNAPWLSKWQQSFYGPKQSHTFHSAQLDRHQTFFSPLYTFHFPSLSIHLETSHTLNITPLLMVIAGLETTAEINTFKRWNFRLVNWDCFTEETGIWELWHVTDDVNLPYKVLCETLLSASRK